MSSISPLTVKGGVVNGDFSLQPAFTAATSTYDRWIDGTSGGSISNGIYKWGLNKASSTATTSAFFTNVGDKNCIKFTISNLQGTDVVGASSARLYPGATYVVSSQSELIPVVANSTYRLNALVNIESATSTTAVKVLAKTTWYQADGITRITTGDAFSVFATTTGSWVSPTVTNRVAPANAAYAIVSFFGANITGTNDIVFSIAEASFNTVTSITNSSSTPALFYPTVTAVTSTDNIDQSQVTKSGVVGLANGFAISRTQSITPTKKNYNGFYFQKGANVGSPTYDVLFSLQTDNGSGKPSGTILKSINIPAATWDSITDATDYFIALPYTVTPGTKYHQVLTASSMGDASNYRTIQWHSSVSYSGGSEGYYDSGAWTMETTKNFYFLTLYSKNTDNFTVSTDTQTVSVTAPTVDGWANGTVVNFSDPLTLASGANAIYVSSNGPSTADGTVDPSLQATMGGEVYGKMYTNQTLLNLINGTVGLSQTACLNSLAGTTGLSRQQAMNAWASTTGLRIQDAVNIKAGTTGLNIQDALYVIAGL